MVYIIYNITMSSRWNIPKILTWNRTRRNIVFLRYVISVITVCLINVCVVGSVVRVRRYSRKGRRPGACARDRPTDRLAGRVLCGVLYDFFVFDRNINVEIDSNYEKKQNNNPFCYRETAHWKTINNNLLFILLFT